MIQLRDKEINKLEIITQLSNQDLTKLSSMGLIDNIVAIDLLIVYEWKRLKRSKLYTTKQIVQAIMDEYQVSRSRVQSAIYQKKKKKYHCDTCGKRIVKSEYVRGGGVCDLCVSKTIKL